MRGACMVENRAILDTIPPNAIIHFLSTHDTTWQTTVSLFVSISACTWPFMQLCRISLLVWKNKVPLLNNDPLPWTVWKKSAPGVVFTPVWYSNFIYSSFRTCSFGMQGPSSIFSFLLSPRTVVTSRTFLDFWVGIDLDCCENAPRSCCSHTAGIQYLYQLASHA